MNKDEFIKEWKNTQRGLKYINLKDGSFLVCDKYHFEKGEDEFVDVLFGGYWIACIRLASIQEIELKKYKKEKQVGDEK